MAVVNFDYTSWATRFPELAQFVQQPQAQMFWNEAGLFCDNTENSPITDDSVGGQRAMLLNLVTAHIAQLNATLASTPSPLVGRINSATQGSVSVQAQNDYPPGSVQWWQQTRYGAAFWMASAHFRAFRYRAKCGRNMDPYSPLGRRW